MKPSELEMQILGVLWSRGPSTARETLENMPDQKQRAYTSVLSVLQAMERKGLVTRSREGLTDHWRPTQAREEILTPYFGDLVRKVLGGKASDVLLHLLGGGAVDEAELGEMEKMIRRHRQQHQQPKGQGDERSTPQGPEAGI